MTSIFQGDPHLVLTEDGVDLDFRGGQPVMDQGFENQVNISLLTKEGWFGNVLFPNKNNKIGSNFTEIASGPITLSALEDISKAAKDALASDAFGNVESFVSNPTSQRINVVNRINPPGTTSQVFVTTKSFNNWLSQATDPANLK